MRDLIGPDGLEIDRTREQTIIVIEMLTLGLDRPPAGHLPGLQVRSSAPTERRGRR